MSSSIDGQGVTTIVLGGTHGIGRHLAEGFARRGDHVVIGGRDQTRAASVAAQIGGDTHGIAVDLAEPSSIAAALIGLDDVENLVVTAIEQTTNSLAAFDLEAAARAVTIKLVGYAEVARTLSPRMTPTGAIVLFGGLAKDRPYPGSTMVTTMNAGLSGLVRTLARELAPRRINAIHPGVVGDSPKWRDLPDHPAIARTPIGRLVTMEETAHATRFLLENTGVNGIDLTIDGGWLIT
jgi:NAD(P)-dependent dehydrogenase (short-subunit alcohol dehydrogenase family)